MEEGSLFQRMKQIFHEDEMDEEMQKEAAGLIRNIFRYMDKDAKDIMTHRKNIVAIDGDWSLEEALQFMLDERFSRFPVYQEDIDEIIGIIHLRDATSGYLDKSKRQCPVKNLEEYLRPVTYIPETKSIDTLFKEMQAAKNHMVVVLDEYGQTSGLVAMEDILEEIVGNILDEYDEEDEMIKKQNDGSMIVNGLTELEDLEDLIPVTNTVITMTKLGYIKRMSVDNFRSQHRGGKGIKGMETIENDYIEELLMTTSHHYLMFFTNSGKVYRMKAYEIPEAGRTARGTAIINLLQLQPGEKITAVIPIKEYKEGEYLFMATKNGIVKKTPICEYANVRKTGLAAINLRDDDELIEVKKTDNNKDIILVTKYGQCIRFHETDVRSTGRVSMGVIGMNLADSDKVVGMQLNTQGDALMIVSEKGLGKCTLMSEFSPQNRGGKGVKCYKITEKTGNIIGVKAVNQDNEIMLITTEGIIIRIPVNGTALLGRVTSGVKLINVNDGVTVASMAKVKEDKSIMENDILEPKQPEGVIVEEDEDASASEEELISKELGELINRAEQDSEEE
mgnify:CR=1 FL=1